MSTIRPLHVNDLFKFNNVSLDIFPKKFDISTYLHYLIHWPEAFLVAEAPNSTTIQAYVLGKAEGRSIISHVHISSVTCTENYRGLGLAKGLLNMFEDVCHSVYNAFFMDLFVRESNKVAIGLYEKLGFVKHKRIVGYYAGNNPEDAWDMRKTLPRGRAFGQYNTEDNTEDTVETKKTISWDVRRDNLATLDCCLASTMQPVFKYRQ